MQVVLRETKKLITILFWAIVIAVIILLLCTTTTNPEIISFTCSNEYHIGVWVYDDDPIALMTDAEFERWCTQEGE